MTDQLVDADARDRIARSHDETLFVDAGAGSGKTSALVSRLVHLVLAGTPVRAIAAITFSEAAAAELRARVRQTLERVAAEQPVAHITDELDPGARAAAATAAGRALDELDGATICTLHAFAQRLLLGAPVEARLPPRVDVHDELSSALRFEDRWRRFERSLLDDDTLEPLLRASLVLGIRSSELPKIASTLGHNWDLVEEADRAGVLEEQAQTPVDLTLDVEGWIAKLRSLLARRDECTNPDCKLLAWLDDDCTRLVRTLEANRSDPYTRLELTEVVVACRRSTGGRKTDWPNGAHVAIKDEFKALQTDVKAARGAVVDAVLTRLGVELARYTLADARARRREGQLEFHDLLVLARGLLRADHGVRRRFHERYTRLLIDEFQDTDPLQIEIAMRLAASPDASGDRPWSELDAAPGRLFFVGDPKQSIYRFRRADIDLFERTASRYEDGQTSLVVNFRTVVPILEFCNGVFGHLIGDTVSHDASGRIAQPAYRALAAHRSAPDGDPGPSVLVLDGEHATVGSAKESEARAVAASLRRAEEEGWLVQPRGAEPRACTWSDMTILVPSRSTLAVLRTALEAEAVPYRIESGTLVYGTTEVNDLLAVLQAIDDPGDEIAVTGALRSAMYGCGDDDLRRWVRGGRRLEYLGANVRSDEALAEASARGEAIDPVEASLADLRRRHRDAPFRTVPEVVTSVVDDRALMAIAVLGGDRRDVWRLYRVVTEHARQFADTEQGGLRAFLHWVGLQRDDKVRANSPVIPEADVDAVRIMTIHGSKGLEFGITAVSGLSGQDPTGRTGPTVLFRPEGGFDIRMRSGMETTRFESARVLEDTMDEHERIRLLYVGLTRARDHLIVSAHRKTGTARSHGARLADAIGRLALDEAAWCERQASPASVDDAPAPDEEREPGVVELAALPPTAATDAWLEDEQAWIQSRHSSWIGNGAVVSATALSRLAHPAVDGASDDEGAHPEQEPWRRGRGGTEVGSAVHAVLQHVDLTDPTPEQLGSLSRWQAGVEGVLEAAGEVEVKATAMANSTLVRRAVASRRWRREVHVSAPVAAVLGVEGALPAGVPVQVEGFVDLLFDDGDGLVVVDYKTDGIAGAASVAAALERHTPQGAAYALALEAAVGRPVTEVHFLFVRGDEAVDAQIEDLDAAKDAVRASLRGAAT